MLSDICCWCHSELDPENPEVKTLLGSKTQLEWYLCVRCQKLARDGLDAIHNLIADEDEEIYQEDQAASEQKNEANTR